MSVLKKQFVEKDVQRLRNIVRGKYGEKTQLSVGYTKKQEFHKEGDIWEEDGRKWTIKDGIKQNITKLDSAKKSHKMPLLCPECKKVMNKRNDKTFYNIHKMCFKCVSLKETELKNKGEYSEYETKIKNDEIDNKIKLFKEYIQEKLQEKSSYVTEAGDIEKWRGELNKDEVEEYTKNIVTYLEGLKT